MTLDTTTPAFGEFEGESVDRGRIKLSGGGAIPRKLGEGERVILVVEGVAGLPAFERDKKTGELRRVDTVVIETLGEPVDDLVSDAQRFVDLIRDLEDDGQARLELEAGDDTEGEGA